MSGMRALQEQVDKITSLDLCRQWSSCSDGHLWEPRWWSGNSSQGCPSGRVPWRDPVCRRWYMHMYARPVQQRCIHAKQANPPRCSERNCTSLWKSGEAVDVMHGWLLCGLITGKHYKNVQYMQCSLFCQHCKMQWWWCVRLYQCYKGYFYRSHIVFKFTSGSYVGFVPNIYFLVTDFERKSTIFSEMDIVLGFN